MGECSDFKFASEASSFLKLVEVHFLVFKRSVITSISFSVLGKSANSCCVKSIRSLSPKARMFPDLSISAADFFAAVEYDG